MKNRLHLIPVLLAFAALALLAFPVTAALPPQEEEVPQTAEAEPIVVGPPETLNEAQLKMAVRLALLEHLKDDAFPIKITVDGNSVILSGAVLYRSTQELATEVTKSVEGVYRVHNLIRISPDAPGKGDHPAKKAATTTSEEVSDAARDSLYP